MTFSILEATSFRKSLMASCVIEFRIVVPVFVPDLSMFAARFFRSFLSYLLVVLIPSNMSVYAKL